MATKRQQDNRRQRRNSRAKLRKKIHDYKVRLLELKLMQAAGHGRPYDNVQIDAIDRLINKYESHLTALPK